YTPSTNSWATVAPMPTARGFLAAATGPDGRIYAIGGYKGGYLTTVEAYDTGFMAPANVPEAPASMLLLVAGTAGIVSAVVLTRRRGWRRAGATG
ncbi:MAG: hypothetical protein JF887_00325, partial [Candidatus Dormibacteraeota bacterium]|nr:hypothetical protein [Candidatus Dormibacteraeota bacterium]